MLLEKSMRFDIRFLNEQGFRETLDKLEELLSHSKAILLGAGTSCCGGLPLTNELTQLVINSSELCEDSKKILKTIEASFLNAPPASHSVIDNLTGGTGQKEVSIRELLNVFVFIPCVEEQRKVAEVVSLTDQEINTIQKKLDCLNQEKKTLMQQLLTGKKRIKGAA
jgi:hypothetical protein